ncbi:PGF-pre-PGF domain-containing protein [Candidatus Woesearchaeota archaeon]|nr:MAG: PGF-pre-PGF domain-containing protein [Candidatus Woesearchaeota archaeon]
MKKRFVKFILFFLLILFGVSSVGAFTLHGQVKNSTFAAVQNANVTVYDVAMNPGQPPTYTLIASDYTNSTGGFEIANLNSSYDKFYKIKITYRSDDKTGNVTEMSPILPELPGADIANFLDGATFYLITAATLEIRAHNGTAATGFNYLLFDNNLGFPIEESMFNYVNTTKIYVPRGRNYTLLMMKNPEVFSEWEAAPPITESINNISAYSSQDYVLYINKSLENYDYNVYGWIWVDGNTSAVNVSYLMPNLAPAGMLPQNSEINFGMSVLNTSAGMQMPDSTGKMSVAFYNYSVLGAPSGIEQVLVGFAHNYSLDDDGEFFAVFQNITVTGDMTINLTMTPTNGLYSDTQGNKVNTSKFKVTLINGEDQSSPITDLHVEVYETLANGYELRRFIDQVTMPESGYSYFELPMLQSSEITMKFFSNQFAPFEKKINTSLDNITVTLNSFNLQKFDEDAGVNATVENFSDLAGIGVLFVKNTPECSKPGFDESNCMIGDQLNGEFNPMQALMAGKANIDIFLGEDQPEVFFIGVDLLASGPPDAVMSQNANFENDSGDSLEELWKFGSLAPDIYDAAIVGVPINTSKVDINEPIYVRLDYLYDNDWNVVWTADSDPSAANVPSDYSDYNLSWLNRSAGGMYCYNDAAILSADQYCYINKSDEMLYMKIPHFTNIGSIISGSVAIGGYVTVWYPLNTSYTTDSLYLNVTTNVTATCVYSLNGAANVSMTGNLSDSAGTFFNASFTASQGSNTVRVTCNRSATNYSVVDQNFYVDSLAPGLTLNLPLNNSNSSLSYRTFNWSLTDISLSLTCNLSIDGSVNVSQISAVNGTNTRTVSGLSLGSHNWSVTCWDAFNQTNTSLTYNFSRYDGPMIYLGVYNKTYNLTSTKLNMVVSVSDMSTIVYSLDGGANTTLCTNCSSNVTNLSLATYGSHNVVVYATDASGNVKYNTTSFYTQPDTDGDGTADADDNDDDNDGVNDAADTITGNSSNVNTNVPGFELYVNGSNNMSLNFTGTYVVNATNGTAPIVVFNKSLSNSSKLVLSNLTIEIESSTENVGRVVVRNAGAVSGTKVVYVNKKNDTQEWVCVYDAEPGLNTTLTPTCEGTGETRVRCNGTASGSLTCSEVNGRLKVSGLSYSVAQSMCRENWTVGSWSSCSSGTQTRTVTDTNGCGTELEKPATSQSCSSDDSSSSSSSTTTTSLASTDQVEDKISYIVGNIEPGAEKTVKLTSDAIGITEIKLKVKEAVYGVKIVVEKFVEKPSAVTQPEGKVYKYWQFSNVALPDDKIEQAKIKFKVERSWLASNSLNTGDIVLARYENNEWKNLDTVVTKSEQDYVYYEATTTGFSYFAVRALAKSSETTTEEQTKEEPKANESAVTQEQPQQNQVTEEQKEPFKMPWRTIGIVVLAVIALTLLILSLVYFIKVRNEKMELMREKVKPRVIIKHKKTKPKKNK